MRDTSNQIDSLETSRTRKPADIYDFWNDQATYRVTSADEELTYGGYTYEPAYIGRERIGHSSDMTISKLQINVDKLQPEVKSYLTAAPLDKTWVRVMRIFRNQSPREAMVYFMGTLARCRVQGRKASLECEGLEKFLGQSVPRLRYQKLCSLSLYGTQCGVTAASYKDDVTLDSMASDLVTLTCSSFALKSDDYYTFGWLEWSGYRRMIVYHTGSTIILRHYIPDMTGSASVSVYAGCDKTMTACRDKFNNLNNPLLDRFFGFPYLPYDNPTMWS
jgi:uncharacterized phage protein (TIGR02218 family)